MHRLIRTAREWLLRAEHLTDSEIAGFLDRAFTGDERTRIESHLAGCAECRVAATDVSRMAHEFSGQQSIPWVRRRSARPIRIVALAGMVAASVATVVMIRADSFRPTESVVRSEPAGARTRYVIEVVSPGEATAVESRELSFLWRGTGAEVYRLSVFDEHGAVVHTAETADTLVWLPREVDLEPGQIYLWRVDAIIDGLAGSSGARKLRVKD